MHNIWHYNVKVSIQNSVYKDHIPWWQINIEIALINGEPKSRKILPDLSDECKHAQMRIYMIKESTNLKITDRQHLQKTVTSMKLCTKFILPRPLVSEIQT